MEYDLIDAGPCRKKLTLKFTPDDVNVAFEESYKEINGYVQIKGFRKGKAPRRALEKRFAKEAASGAREYLTEQNLRNVIDEAKLQLIGPAALKNRNSDPSPGLSFNLEVEMDVMPEFDLPGYTGLEITDYPVDVTDAQVDESLERYRKMFASYDPVEEPAGIGDVLKVDFVARVDDEEIINMADQRLRVEGEILFGLPCPDLQDKFAGAKAGDIVSLTVNMPADHPNVGLRGRPALIEVSVKGVERGALPELDDAFAANLGMDTIADFRQRVRGNLVREALVAAKQKQEDEIVDQLLEKVAFDLPVDLVESETQTLVDSRRGFLLRSGVKDDEAMKTQLEQYRPEAAKQAARKVRWGLMATKIGEKENITVTNDDLAAQVEALAQSYNTTPAKIIQRIREFDGVQAMTQEILSMKVIQFISDHAKGGRLDPDRKDADSGSTNAAAAESVVGADEGEAEGEGEGCACGHDHEHEHDHECGCGHAH